MSDVASPRGWRRIAQAFGTPSALTLCVLGFGCGLPFLLVGFTLSTWLRREGIELGVIGLVSYAGLFYTFKFLWAPLLDRYRAPLFSRLGRRRGWLLLSQLVLALSLAAMALAGPTMSLPLFVALLALAAFAGSTQDTLVDAYRIEIAPLSAQAALAATYTLGYRIAVYASGAGALYVAAFAGWTAAYLAMAGLMLLPALTTLLAREPDAATDGEADRGIGAAFLRPFLEFFRRNGLVLALVLLAFVGLYKMPDQMLGVIAGPFYLDTGFDEADIASVSKTFGIVMALVGAFLGGVAAAGIGLRWSLVIAAVVVGASNLAFLLMSLHPGELWTFVAAITADNTSQGFAGTVLIAFMSSLVNKHYSATQYALLSSLANLPGKLVGGLSGFIVEDWGFGYTGFFVISTLSVVPTLLLLAWLWPRIAGRADERPA